MKWNSADHYINTIILCLLAIGKQFKYLCNLYICYLYYIILEEKSILKIKSKYGG